MGDLPDTEYRRTLDRYALYGEIAAGGMATVHYGRVLGAQSVPRVVAIKRLLPELAKDPTFVRMFLAEGRIASRIRHPNVVATHDVVALPGRSGHDGELFHVMEYVAGDTLSRLVRKSRRLERPVPPRIAVSIACGFLEGLHAAHEAKSETGEPLGLVHRDVSPQNVMVGIDGMARVVDFGIATATHMVEEAPDRIKGKVGYMAPEQLAHETVDRRTDVYAASVVLWEALTGHRLFKAENLSQLIVKVMADPVGVPSDFAEGIPSDLDMVIMKGLSRDARDRWASARELAVLLEQVLPPAPLREVGAWALEIGGDRLRYRGEVVAAIEAQSIAHLKIPSGSRDFGNHLALAKTELALAENALPPVVERTLASDPQIKAILLRRSQPLIVESHADVAPPPAPSADLSPSVPRSPPEGLREPHRRTPVPAAPVSSSPRSGREPRLSLGPVGRSMLMALGAVTLVGGAAYVGLTLGSIEPPPTPPSTPGSASLTSLASTAASPAPTIEEAIGLGATDSGGPRGRDASDCAVPYTVDAHGVKKPKPQCLKR